MGVDKVIGGVNPNVVVYGCGEGFVAAFFQMNPILL